MLVRGTDTFMRPSIPGGAFYWAEWGNPVVYPSRCAADKAALMQGGVVITASPYRGKITENAHG